MAKYVSPGVYVVENDNSDYVPSINPSVVGIVGFASKGPTDKATLITDEASLIATFGEPLAESKNGGQAIEGGVEVLETTNSLYFVRAADGGDEASAGVPYGVCPAVSLSSDIGDSKAAYLKISVKNSAGTQQYTTPLEVFVSAAGDQEAALNSAFGSQIEAAKVNHVRVDGSSIHVGGWAGSGAELIVSSFSDSAYTTATSAVLPLSSTGIGAYNVPDASLQACSVTAAGLTLTDMDYKVESVYVGTGYNYTTKADGSIAGNRVTISTTGGTKNQLFVEEDGVTLEDFTVGTVEDDNFIEDEINTGATDLKSNIIKGNIFVDGADVTVTSLTAYGGKVSALVGSNVDGNGATDINPRFVKLVDGSYKLANGTDGIPSASNDKATALIGVDNDAGKTGMQVLNDDLIGVTLAAVPGFTTESVQNALVTLAESTNLFLALLSPPYGITKTQDAIDWSNGLGYGITGNRNSALNSSYAAIYWPWVKVFDAFSGKDKYYDPVIFAMRQMCFTDSVAEAWFAPAGLNRGRLTKPTEVEVTLTQGDRDAMYSGGNVINPIVNFPQQGIAIYGQRTTQRKPSALDRVNVRRLMIIIRKLVLQSTAQFAFEPNDPVTWDQVKGLITQLLDPIRRGRGITSYQVVCDSTTNTPARIEKGQLWCKVYIRPTKTAEVVVFELNLTGQSVTTT